MNSFGLLGRYSSVPWQDIRQNFLRRGAGFFYRTRRECGLSIFGLRDMGKARENGYMLQLKARAADQCY
jgi:hypothetical protein